MTLKPLTVRKYGDSYKITLCKYDVWKKKEKNEVKLPPEWQDLENRSKEECNIIRAKNKVLEYAKCNEWEWFATLTLNERKQDRFDLKQYVKDLGQMIRDIRKITHSEIKYLLIPEQHKNGAWHIHGYFKGLPENAVSQNQYGYYSWKEYEKRFGYCSLDRIKDKDRCDSYITKYISKDMGGTAIEVNKKLYYVTRGLSTAEIIHSEYVGKTLSESDYENDYVQVKWTRSLSEVNAIIADLSE